MLTQQLFIYWGGGGGGGGGDDLDKWYYIQHVCFFLFFSLHIYTHIENVQELFCGGGLQGPRCQHLGVIFVREKLQKDHNNVTHTCIRYCTLSFCVWEKMGNDSGYEALTESLGLKDRTQALPP